MSKVVKKANIRMSIDLDIDINISNWNTLSLKDRRKVVNNQVMFWLENNCQLVENATHFNYEYIEKKSL